MSVEVLFENKIYEKEFKDRLSILLKINEIEIKMLYTFEIIYEKKIKKRILFQGIL
jgi:hypothetical protein